MIHFDDPYWAARDRRADRRRMIQRLACAGIGIGAVLCVLAALNIPVA